MQRECAIDLHRPVQAWCQVKSTVVAEAGRVSTGLGKRGVESRPRSGWDVHRGAYLLFGNVRIAFYLSTLGLNGISLA